jgi:hypothetical protein
MYVTIKQDAPVESKQVYKIKDVQIYAGYSLNMDRVDSSRSQAQYYKGYYIIDRRKRYKPSMFAQAMNFEPGMCITGLITTLHLAALSILIFSNL